LDRSARVGDRIGELATSGFADATVGEVADMTVSVGYDEDYLDAGEAPSVGDAFGFGDAGVRWGPGRHHPRPGPFRTRAG
jgi:hypothetical protein